MPRRKTTETPYDDRSIQIVPLKEFSNGAMLKYGSYNIENRAIPDYRDGLKPIHRRIIWTAYELGVHGYKGVNKKCARIVGDVLGKYHPHGDTAAYEALVNMTHSCQPTIYGSGSFGSLVDEKGPYKQAAAYRYTEARLTEYADKMLLDKDLLAVLDFAPNFDGSEQEPIVLPSLLPNLLLNGAYGIAVGTTCSIPAFEPEGVIKITRKALQGKKITANYAFKNLVPKSQEGGYAVIDDYWGPYLKEFLEKGYGQVRWGPAYEYENNNTELVLWGFVPAVAGNLNRALERLADNPAVDTVIDESDLSEEVGEDSYLSYRVRIKRSIPKKDRESTLDELYYYFEASQSLSFTVTERKEVIDGEVNVAFARTDITDFMERWCKWRVEIERKSITRLNEIEQEQLDKDQQLLKIVKMRDKIIDNLKEALNSDNPAGVLKKKLGIKQEMAEAIIKMRIGQLQRLEQEQIEKRIKSRKITIKRYEKEYDDPVPRISSMIDEVEFSE